MLNSTHDVVGSTAVARPATARDTTAAREPYGLNDLMALSVSTGAVSPAMAKAMREAMHFERQRPIDQRNVERLAEEMKRGWFLSGTPLFICVLPDGREYLVNGNHTLEAIAASGVTVPLVMIRRRVRDMEEAARCYAVLDLQKTRTWANVIQAAGLGDDLPNSTKVLSALGVILMNFDYRPQDRFMQMSRNMRLEMIPDYTIAAHALHDAMKGGTSAGFRCITRAAIMAVALYTMRYQPSLGAEFWGALAADDGLKQTDPRKALLRFSQNNPSGGSSSRVLQSKAAMLAWNAFFEGRALEYCKPQQMGAMRILGTPWHKGEPA